MHAGMARRKEQDDDQKALILVYTTDLSEYPSDVVRDVCRTIRRERKFFPTISELRDECEARYEMRRALRKELENILTGRKALEAPDERTGVHWKMLDKKRWLAMHYDWWIADAEDMFGKAQLNPQYFDAKSWEGEVLRRKKEAHIKYPDNFPAVEEPKPEPIPEPFDTPF